MFHNIGFNIKGITHISGLEAMKCINNGAFIVDIRELYDINYKAFDIENLLLIPKSQIDLNINVLPKDKFLIIADSFGINSKPIVTKLIENGFNKVANLIGGIMEWEKDGLPIKKNVKEEIDGPCMCMLKTRKKLINK